jgi:hypothetical protein
MDVDVLGHKFVQLFVTLLTFPYITALLYEGKSKSKGTKKSHLL